jgi:hypothetical protein
VASVFKHIHPDKPAIATSQRIQDFFAAKRRKTVKIPSIQDMETWDTDLLVVYIKKHWLKNEELSLEDLQRKMIGLICLTTMARPRSDIGRLRYQDVILKEQEGQKMYEILHFREAKEVQGKSIPIGMGEDGDMCPVRTLNLL